MKKEFSTSQMIAVRMARKCWGKRWKACLLESWESGKYPIELREYSADLQTIRNNIGPSGLIDQRFFGS